MRALAYVPIPAFDDNYIWLVTDGRHAIVADPGDAKPVREYCSRHGLKISGILVTHHHGDHVGGIADLLASTCVQAGVRISGPAAERIDGVNDPVVGGMHISFAAPHFAVTVIDVPGHTSGHVAYFQIEHDGDVPHLFCGDTLFASGCGRLFEGTPEQMLVSLDTLASLPEETLVHCAHEYTLTNVRFSLECDADNWAAEEWYKEVRKLRAAGLPSIPTSIGHERRVNPFLRVSEPAIRHSLQEKFAMTVPDRVTGFRLLREWKSSFR